MGTLTKEAEYKRLAIKHKEQGDEYAARSFDFDGIGELADHYSSVAEAHHNLAAEFSKLSGEPQIQEREP